MASQSPPRGKLKVFLAYADGVGKTYAMLEAAQRRKAEGVDVVAAWVETHQHSDTQALSNSLENLSGQEQAPGGASTLEMDLDSVLRRKPRLALVDDLAHRNPAGARHPERYQDVEELLDAGIDVYTTLNIQNLASLNDLVQQYTGVTVDISVPDSFLDQADELELVDLPPEELLQRLRSDSVNAPVASALLQKENLETLRELTLREAVEHLDDRMRTSATGRSLKGAWPAGDRVMVCISSHPLGERLVRAGRRLADSLDADWFVVYVETPGHLKMKPEQRARLLRTLRIAEEMGAHPVALTGDSVPETVVDFANQQGIRRIVIGRPLRAGWQELFRGSLVEQIVRRSKNIDVYVISGEDTPASSPAGKGIRFSSPPLYYLAAFGMVALVTALGLPLKAIFDPSNLIMLYLAVVMLAASFLGLGPSILASVLGTLAFAYVFSQPAYTITLRDTRHVVTLAGLLVAGLVISNLATLLRLQVRASRQREIHSAAINALSHDLTVAFNLEDMLQAVVRNVGATFGREVAVFLPEGMQLAARATSPGLELGKADYDLADWAFQHGQPAGTGTDTYPQARIRCLPLKTGSSVVGVLGVGLSREGELLSPEQRDLLYGLTNLAALAIERARLNEQASQNAVLQATERLQTALLNSISHDLRTPLATVSGTISSLLEDEENGRALEHAARLDLLENANDEAERLNRLVGNMLDMTRLESGAMKLKIRPCDVQDVAGAALAQSARRLAKRTVHTHIAAGIPPAALDFVLMVQVLVNLLDNAEKYSPANSPIEVGAEVQEGRVRITVCDHGAGIPEEDLERVFGKFYRVQRVGGVPGTGLGLSICRGIVEAHGGRIWAENRAEGGTRMVLELPLYKEEKP